MSNRSYAERKKDFYAIMQAAQNAGIPHPEIVAAQWALESDWGRAVTGTHNYWGVKAGNGDPNNKYQGTVAWTKENINGKSVSMQQKFRDYGSLDEALRDRAKFTSRKGGIYDKAGYFSATSPAEAARALEKAGYATDPHYADSLIKVMKGIGVDPYNGQQYDYSTTPQQPIVQQFSPFQPPSLMEEAQHFTPPTVPKIAGVDNGTFEQLNQFQDEQPKISNRQKYQEQLADAFGIAPKVDNGLPDYIGDLVKSIYDKTV